MKTIVKNAICASIVALALNNVLADDPCKAAREDAELGFRQAASLDTYHAIDSLRSALDNSERCITGQDSNRPNNASDSGSNDSSGGE